MASPTAPPGSSILLPVTFASQGDSVSGIQFDLQYDNTQMSVSATISDAARSAGKSLYIASLAPNKIRFLFVGLNQVLIPDGTLCTLFLSLNTNAPGGSYALVLSELSRTNPQSQSESVQGLDGNVFVQGSSSQAMRIQPNGVLGAASLLPGPVSPGELVTLLGAGIGPAEPISSPGSPSLGETAVLFDGSPAPMLYAGPNQINAVVPFSVAGKISTLVQVTYRNQVVSTFSFPVAATVPAVFTQDSSGVGPGAILNQDSTLNTPSSPADKGSIISIFATGAGQTNPLSVDGQLAGDGSLPKPSAAGLGANRRFGCSCGLRRSGARLDRRDAADQLHDPAGRTVRVYRSHRDHDRLVHQPARRDHRRQLIGAGSPPLSRKSSRCTGGAFDRNDVKCSQRLTAATISWDSIPAWYNCLGLDYLSNNQVYRRQPGHRKEACSKRDTTKQKTRIVADALCPFQTAVCIPPPRCRYLRMGGPFH